MAAGRLSKFTTSESATTARSVSGNPTEAESPDLRSERNGRIYEALDDGREADFRVADRCAVGSERTLIQLMDTTASSARGWALASAA